MGIVKSRVLKLKQLQIVMDINVDSLAEGSDPNKCMNRK